ncbi:hypothetical protein [Geosporobacter ferrireducens]|uniref:Uncharacterized protein n=1 Tax=Geosporobacter ferrireducens TaxID=1424294 RepID=A0A1D8GLW0_9FIRM|nr:hypothetical protein [Geosporobacter ferrireducens]AOT71904.1 hypothetical protein Gferi_21620 [Geosporobacter ferrireducens]MTI55695.1 hypothetical protein [Geosporobacter ferrireducens]
MDYIEWNELIAQHFFNNSNAGREVVLYVTDELINELGKGHRADVEDFIEAVKSGPSWAYEKELCLKANHALERSVRDYCRDKYPLYLAYLAFFVLAVDTEGDFSEIAYYPKLNTRLGDFERKNAPSRFHLIEKLWYDLQEWSMKIKKEELGRFTIKPLGRWCHVGLPLSQTLLTSEERVKLSVFFAEYAFDSSSPPSSIILSNAICKSNIFKNRTKKLIESNKKEHKHLRNALLDFIQEELKEWNGLSCDDGEKFNSDRESWINNFLRLCIEIDNLAMIIKFTARFKAKYEFPEEELQFVSKRNGVMWTCKESSRSWSRPIMGSFGKKSDDASILDWKGGEEFIDMEFRWKLKLKPSLVRVFESGALERINGWIEANKVEPNKEYLILYHETCDSRILAWAKKSCADYKVLSVSGLPNGWIILKAREILKSHPDFEELKFSSGCTLGLKDGIKSGRGNRYFRFAAPKICIDGAVGNEIIRINGTIIERNEENLYLITNTFEADNTFKIELIAENMCIATRTIILEEPRIHHQFMAPYRDKFGIINNKYMTDNEFSISGVNIRNISPKIEKLFVGQLPTYLSHTIIFLGRHAGQIAEWPKDRLPNDWEAVWAVYKVGRDKWKAFFVGKDIEQCSISEQNRTNPKWKKWKKVFINMYVEPSNIKRIRQLWMEYKRGAKSV